MNKEIEHKFRNRKVAVLFDNNKDLIGYSLVSYTPKFKRVISEYFTTEKRTAKEFLN